MKQRVSLIEQAIANKLGELSSEGALVVNTGKWTGRATKEKFIVERPETKEAVDWNSHNQPVDAATAEQIFSKLEDRLSGARTYSYSGFVGGFPIEVVSPSAWHILFAENMFRSAPSRSLEKLARSQRSIRILHFPEGKVSDLGVSFKTDTAIILDPAQRRIAVIGTSYAGEIKKSAFTLANFLLPEHRILPMHASANCRKDGTESSLLFGLSGTGKTTLSAAANRPIVGDDEIVWSPEGLMNLEGGCYAKLIDLTPEKEPEIHAAVNRFGAILENVVMDRETRKVDFSDRSRTENTRGSYPISHLSTVFDQTREAAHPRTIVFLTADAFGALPPVAKLDSWQAKYHFLSGYTSKVAGTELGVKEPTTTFSACFGAPFMPRHPHIYADLLAEYAEKSGATFWLLNTGWMAGGYGKAERYPLKFTRQLLEAIQSGQMGAQPMSAHPVFGFQVPKSCPDIEDRWFEISGLDQARALASKFVENFRKFSGEECRKIAELGGPRA